MFYDGYFWDYGATTIKTSVSIIGIYRRDIWFFFGSFDISIYIYFIITVILLGIVLHISKEEESIFMFSLMKVITCFFAVVESPKKLIITKIIFVSNLAFTFIIASIFTSKLVDSLRANRFVLGIHTVGDLRSTKVLISDYFDEFLLKGIFP